MTTKSINDQVRIIKTATEKALSSKEAAIAFLRNAGIIDIKAAKATKALKGAHAKSTN